MAEYFINIKGVRQGQFKGDNPNLIGRADWIAGIGFTMQLIQPVSEPSGAPSGRRTYKPIQITKQWGAASPQIFKESPSKTWQAVPYSRTTGRRRPKCGNNNPDTFQQRQHFAGNHVRALLL